MTSAEAQAGVGQFHARRAPRRRKDPAVTSVRNAMIIGGGIAGPAMAMAVQMAGIDPVVYEARQATADRTGAFLTVASNGISALRVLGAGQAILDPGFPTPSITLRGCTGKHLGANSTGLTLPDGTTSHTIKRADLYRALREQARQRGIGVEF